MTFLIRIVDSDTEEKWDVKIGDAAVQNFQLTEAQQHIKNLQENKSLKI